MWDYSYCVARNAYTSVKMHVLQSATVTIGPPRHTNSGSEKAGSTVCSCRVLHPTYSHIHRNVTGRIRVIFGDVPNTDHHGSRAFGSYARATIPRQGGGCSRRCGGGLGRCGGGAGEEGGVCERGTRNGAERDSVGEGGSDLVLYVCDGRGHTRGIFDRLSRARYAMRARHFQQDYEGGEN